MTILFTIIITSLFALLAINYILQLIIPDRWLPTKNSVWLYPIYLYPVASIVFIATTSNAFDVNAFPFIEPYSNCWVLLIHLLFAMFVAAIGLKMHKPSILGSLLFIIYTLCSLAYLYMFLVSLD